jgi:hypothetical protein
MAYMEYDYGQFMPNSNGEIQGSSCGYLSIANGDKTEALARKLLLAPLATYLSAAAEKSNFGAPGVVGNDASKDYAMDNIMADTNVWLAYAILIGPIRVFNVGRDETNGRNVLGVNTYEYVGRPRPTQQEWLRSPALILYGDHFRQLWP